MLLYQDMKTTQTTGWRTMTAAQLLQLAADLRAVAAHTTLPRMRRGLLLRAALREKRAAALAA